MRVDRKHILLEGLGLSAIALLDYFTPLGSAVPILYAVVVAYGAALGRSTTGTLAVALIASALTVAGYFFSATEVVRGIVVWGNRGMAIAAIWTVTLLARAYQLTRRKKFDLGAKLDRMMEAASDYAILQLAPDGSITWWNLGAQRIYGYRSEQVIGKQFATLFPDDEQPAPKEALRQASAAGRIEWEGQRQKSSGEVFPVRALLGKLPDEIPPHGYCEITQDLTERHQMERRERLARRMQAMGVVAAGVSHDLNNIFSVILGRSELVTAQRASSDAVAKEDGVEEIRIAAERGAAMTTKLLAFGKRQPLHPRAFDLNGLIEEMEEFLRLQTPNHISRRHDLEPDLPPAVADPVQVQQVLINLVGNACHAMPDGGLLTIQTGCADMTAPKQNAFSTIAPGSYVFVRVLDTGSGIEEAVLPEIVEPFFSTKSESGGSGLGLAAVFGILTQSGGGFDLENRPQGGVVATGYLRRASPSEIVSAENWEPAKFDTESNVGSILAVSNEESIRELIYAALTRKGYEVRTLAPSEAVDALKDQDAKIALLLADLVMPTLSGLQLSKVAARRKPPVETLLMAGYADPAESLGQSSNLLTKPFTVQQLVAAVRERVGDPPPQPEMS